MIWLPFPVEVINIRHFSMSLGGSKLIFWMFRSIVFNNRKVVNIRIKSASLFALKCAFEMEFIMLGQKKTETQVRKTDDVCDPIVVWGKVSY